MLLGRFGVTCTMRRPIASMDGHNHAHPTVVVEHRRGD
jgi:hypothetical protein